MSSREVSADTLALLEERLRRVDYVLNGNHNRNSAQSEVKASATARLRHLERNLQSLNARSPAVADILALQRAQPTLFHTNSATPPTLPPSTLASLVLAHRQLYTSTAASLSSLQDTHIPNPGAAAKLVELQPRISKASARQQQQMRELAELRARSAKAVEKWYESGVLEMGEHWAEWEERVREAEILVRRREAAKKREEGAV